MKKMIKKILLIMCIFLISETVHAASLSISTNSSSVTIGSSVVVRVNASDLAGRFSVTSSNGSVLSGGTSSTWIENSTQTFTFKANNVGTSTITVTPVDVADYSGNVYTASKSVTITVKAKPVIVLSGDNTLSSLSVEGKELSPAFNKDTLEYSVELEPETTSINVIATPTHGGAGIAGAGVREVVDGSNRLEIVVTAENGSARTYVINASVKEYNPIEQTVDGKKYTVVRKRSLLTAPENYTESTVKIGEEEVPSFTSEVTKYTLVGLKNEAGNIGLYVYQDGTYKLYSEYTFNKVKFYPLELSDSDIPDGYEKTDITYNDQKIIAYKTSELSNYSLLYGMNIETGEVHMYMYDEEEDTLQIYNDEVINSLREELEQMKLLVAGLAGGCVFLFLLCIIIGCSKKKNKKDNKKSGLDSIDDIQVTQLAGNSLSKKEEKRIQKQEQLRKQEEDKKFKKEEKKRLKEDAKRLKEELKQEKKNNKKKKKEKEAPIDIRNL